MSEQNLNTNHNRNYLHSLKTLDYRIFIASFCGLILTIFLLLFDYPRIILIRNYISIPLIEVRNYDYEPLESGIVTIKLNSQSQISVNNYTLDGYVKFEDYIEDGIIIKNSDRKVLLIVEDTVPFEKVNQILQSLSKIGIKEVGLLAKNPMNPVIKYMREKIFYRDQIKKH